MDATELTVGMREGRQPLGLVIERLAEAAEADEIYLFGSSMNPDSRHKDSDIDLCFIVPDDGDLKKASRRAQDAFADRIEPMDLVGIRRVDFDGGKTLLAREVLRCGRLVYSRKKPR